jgi:hypothetical protein
MGHHKMLAARRRKARGKKQLAVLAKRAKKLRKQDLKRGSADAPKTGPS